MSRLTSLAEKLKQLSTGPGAVSLPNLASLRVAMPTTGKQTIGARRFVKQLLPKLKYANPGVRVELIRWSVHKAATAQQLEEMNEEQREAEKARVKAQADADAKRKIVMNVEFEGMPSREILLTDKRDGDILGELKKMASFSGSDQDKPKVESVTPVPPVLVARTAPAEAVAEARAAKPVRVAKPVPVRVVAEAASAKAAPVAGATS